MLLSLHISEHLDRSTLPIQETNLAFGFLFWPEFHVHVNVGAAIPLKDSCYIVFLFLIFADQVWHFILHHDPSLEFFRSWRQVEVWSQRSLSANYKSFSHIAKIVALFRIETIRVLLEVPESELSICI